MVCYNRGRTRSVSTNSTIETRNEKVLRLVQAVRDVDGTSFEVLHESLLESACLARLRHSFIDQQDPQETKDAFRRAHGFQAILGLLRTLTPLYHGVKASALERKHFFAVLSDSLSVLGTALENHPGNQKHFRQTSDGGGWQSLLSSLEILNRGLLQSETPSCDVEKFLGLFLATATCNETISDIYVQVQNCVENVGIDDAKGTYESSMAAVIEGSLQRSLADVGKVSVPDLLLILTRIWEQQPRRAETWTIHHRALHIAIPLSLKHLLIRSRQSLVAAHTAGLLSAVLPFLFNTKKAPKERQLFQDVALMLCEEGVSSLEDAAFLYSEATRSSEAASFLLHAIRAAQKPPSIQLDLSFHGYASVELPTLSKTFPPADTGGYTLAVWAKFDHFDPNAHTTIFGAFDATQTCFVLAYLEKDSRQFILQTSVRGSKPSVRLKSTVFDPGRWYHICIVHRRPRTTTSSRASLFVDGEFVEQVRAAYPSMPPWTTTSEKGKIQAFFGTPRDLALSPSKAFSTSRWSLASSILFREAFSDDLIAVFYQLGPRYHGNFQDCLGSFQTYKASAALNLRNENLHPGKEEQSDIVSAIRQRASHLIPESSILFNASPAAVLDNDDRNNIDESELVRSLSKKAARNLYKYTQAGGHAVAINGAVPAINDALTQVHGVAKLTGDPIIVVPQTLDDASWRLGGCAALGLSLIHAAKSTEDVVTAVNILFETVRDNWRNSEAMEKDNGYAILAALLRDKCGLQGSLQISNAAIPTSALNSDGLVLDLLSATLSFVGYDFSAPEQSVISNPLAYRILLVDTPLWRAGNRAVQELYFQQFNTFAVRCQNHRFNAKRLSRMRVLKKLLIALKSETVSTEGISLYMTAFRSLLPSAISAEMHRSLALFVTYSVNKGKVAPRSKRSTQGDARSGNSSASDYQTRGKPSMTLTKFEIGVEVLRFYSDILCTREDTSIIKKFATTVTNKWLLYLLSETSPEVVVLACRVLARLLVVHGSSYVRKFKDKSGGFTVLRHCLKRWWHLPALWPACLAIMFDFDIGRLDLDGSFDLFGLLDLVSAKSDLKVVYPEAFEVIAGMLQNGLKTIVHSKKRPASSTLSPEVAESDSQSRQRLSTSTMTPPDPFLSTVAECHVETLHTVVRFLADVYTRSANYRNFTTSSTYVQDLLFVLFPVVVGTDSISADTELNAGNSAPTFDGDDPGSRPLSLAPSVVRTVKVESRATPTRGPQLRRGSSFVLVTTEKAKHQPSTSRLQPCISHPMPVAEVPIINEGHKLVQSLLEIVVSIFVDQILVKKDFQGLGLFHKTPPGVLEHQSYFESWVLRNTLSQLSTAILLDQRILLEPKVLTNLARLFCHLREALYEGWFVGGADTVLDFAGTVLEYLQRSDIAKLKTVRLCSQSISLIRGVVFKIVLLSLSEVKETESLTFLDKLAYWQTVLLSSEEAQPDQMQLICYLLYASLIAAQTSTRMAAANLWRIILVQKPEEASAILGYAKSSEDRRLAKNFEKLLEVDNEVFLCWVDDHRDELDAFFFNTLSKSWDDFVISENQKTADSARQRLAKRRDRLKQWCKEQCSAEEIIRRHEVTFDHWTSNIYTSEHQKHMRALQDQQDDLTFTQTGFTRMESDVRKSNGFLADAVTATWRIDQTEGRNRMRLRVRQEADKTHEGKRPRRKGTEASSLRLDTHVSRVSNAEAVGLTPIVPIPSESPLRPQDASSEPFPDLPQDTDGNEKADVDESFELIEDPKEDQDDYEDKNRKVMRSLHRGDQVKQVANVSRIVGLEAVEGLLILGEENMYIIDNFFQRADGEIVNAWQAPVEERDPYLRMISGVEAVDRKSHGEEHETRSWKWGDIISISNRRFLFRDVALELFFADGRSYLLTCMSASSRDKLYVTINSRAPQYGGLTHPVHSEDSWRYESLRSPEDAPQTLGSKFANVFGQATSNPATRNWQKGEMSNFHYLMLINTMAGRTYNDLTQYPVFPWVLSDYTSSELDLSDPKVYRDLSKPMGCQSADREVEFKERYKSFGEMGDHHSPAFHYGTHYSSAMIVTSYLIRLQPFVKSYLLLQGGTFDHADRMFYSIERAWKSASQINMTDVRELTPEFFYLPEFLVNLNGYDFGTRQNSNKSIDAVELPPWAKGDPKIFVAKHREALESAYVSKHLHQWVDLVFGYKQRGEAALEAVNVFQHLSYQGAKDLDSIRDPVERLATIGIIHNFGQTPYQVFQKPHPARDETRHKYQRLDRAAESLTRLPFNLLESGERVSSLLFSRKQDRLLCSAAFRLNIPPHYDKYMEWGFADGSVRFYSADSRKLLGHFEHLHVGQLACGTFADSKMLITAGTDCTVAVWNVVHAGKTVDLLPKSCLFGHRTTVNVLALSRPFSALLSASVDGEIMLWDLNRLEFVRKFNKGPRIDCATINDVTGNIAICRGARITMYTLNGEHLLDQTTGDPNDDAILSCACYEGAGNEWLERDLLFTGHKRGIVRVWSKIIRDGHFELELIRQLDHVDPARDDGATVSSGITCILLMPQVLYTGDEDGRVVSHLWEVWFEALLTDE